METGRQSTGRGVALEYRQETRIDSDLVTLFRLPTEVIRPLGEGLFSFLAQHLLLHLGFILLITFSIEFLVFRENHDSRLLQKIDHASLTHVHAENLSDELLRTAQFRDGSISGK